MPPTKKQPKNRGAHDESFCKITGCALVCSKRPFGGRQVRGKKVEQALNILAFSPKKGADIIKGVLESAIANAEHNEGADIDELKVATICVDQGPVMKRFRAAAKGRGVHIHKPTCHITVTVGD